MGASWRVGVDASERTDLVTAGPFALVRTPIFAATIPAVLELALVVPNAAALTGFLGFLAAKELRVRFVEEPYLLRTLGDGSAIIDLDRTWPLRASLLLGVLDARCGPLHPT